MNPSFFLFQWTEEDTVVLLLTVLVFFVLFVIFLIWLIFWILKKKNRSIAETSNLITKNKNFNDGQTTDLNTLDTSYDKATSTTSTTDFDFDLENKKPIDDSTDDELFDPIEKFKTEVIKLKERLDKEKSDE
ncbi:hypothetical protein JTY60_02460 [symbiont of Argiope bruennichi]|uniref:hypothetical protein n=1 Tax=symbiont of Argiope bruennichi TaxID=2810479 RepID=UPI003DA49D55